MWYGAAGGKALYRLGGLGLRAADAAVTRICFRLGGTCPTMQELCGEDDGLCSFAAVDDSNACCPVGLLGNLPIATAGLWSALSSTPPPPPPPSPWQPPPPSPRPPSAPSQQQRSTVYAGSVAATAPTPNELPK
ncbi:hypothetical protein Vretimale_5847 [Volvox reticuliferus]|nr:hypothetical protein Vretifemale_5717 [Volvox reticuliferus]GIM00967.1 hypothetical protein Vretimale_5847 [Volvox reticuliferus]